MKRDTWPSWLKDEYTARRNNPGRRRWWQLDLPEGAVITHVHEDDGPGTTTVAVNGLAETWRTCDLMAPASGQIAVWAEERPTAFGEWRGIVAHRMSSLEPYFNRYEPPVPDPAIVIDDKQWTQEELNQFPKLTMWYEPSAGNSIHPTVDLNGIKVDTGLAPLIELLWQEGYKTEACCQGCPLTHHVSGGYMGLAYISFSRFSQAAEFALIATQGEFPDGKRRCRLLLEPWPDGRGVARFAPRYIEGITEAVRAKYSQ